MMNSWDDDLTRLQEGLVGKFQEDLSFWMDFAYRSGSPILEIGCGYGRVMLPLLRAGYEVDGLDPNPFALERLSTLIDLEELTPANLHYQSMETFSISRTYKSVIIPCNTLSYIDHEQVANALENVFHHLAAPGQLGIDIPNPAAILSDDPPEDMFAPLDSFIDPISGNGCQVYAQQDYQPQNQCLSITWTYDELLTDGITRRYEQTLKHYLRSQAQMDSLLSAAGFESIHYFGSYDRTPFHPASEYMLIVASRPA